MTTNIFKNEIRLALLNYHKEIIDLLQKYPSGHTLHQFNREMEFIANAIKLDFRSSYSKNSIRKALKGARKSICAAAHKSIKNNKVDSTMFFLNYFGGLPLENETVSDAEYDLVIEVDHNLVVAWIFAPTKDEEINNFEIIQQVDRNFFKKCNKVITKYPVDEENVASVAIPVEATPLPEIPEIPAEDVIEELSEDDEDGFYIGRALLSEDLPIEMKNSLDDRRIYGFVRQNFIPEIAPNNIIAFDSPDRTNTILTKIYEFKPGLEKRSGFEHRYQELKSVVSFVPLMEVANGEESEFRAKNIEQYEIRKPTDEEVLRVTGFPATGVPFGLVRHDDIELVARFPFDPTNMVLEDTIYRSFFVVGTQHSGKTTAAKYWFQALTGYSKIAPEKRPAIIILDGEMGKNSYKQFTPEDEMSPKAQKYIKEQGINPIYHKVYSISDDLSVGDSTLSLEELKFEDLTLFFQNLEEKTENILKQKLKLAFEKCARQKEELTMERIRNFVLEDIRTDSLVYPMQRPAIASALNAIELDIFNQPNKTRITTSMLCQPGKISVINVNGLDIPRRRIVAVAIMQLLHRFKEKEENIYPGVILAMDEAEQLYPIKCSGSEKAYVDRIIIKTKEIADNGRKRHFGQFICTHLADSIDSRVVGLAETTMAFRCSGDDKWIRSTFGKNYVDEINNLKTGEAEVFVRISEQNQKQIKAKVYFPDVSLQGNHNI